MNLVWVAKLHLPKSNSVKVNAAEFEGDFGLWLEFGRGLLIPVSVQILITNFFSFFLEKPFRTSKSTHTLGQSPHFYQILNCVQIAGIINSKMASQDRAEHVAYREE